MWWSSRKALDRRGFGRALAGCLLVSGCGFRPLYGGPEGAAVAEELAAIEVEAPLTRLGRILQNQLIDDLNPAGLTVAKRYRLDLRLRQSRRALAIQLDDTVTRYDLTLAAFFTLRDLDGPGPRAAADDTEPMLPEIPERAEAVPPALIDPDPGIDELEDADPAPGTVFRSAVRRVASYNVIREPFATLIAEQDAERRAAVEVSREIRTLLTIFFETAET